MGVICELREVVVTQWNESLDFEKCELALTTITLCYDSTLKELYMILEKRSHTSQNIERKNCRKSRNIYNHRKYKKSYKIQEIIEMFKSV